jgi:hypothetical protein
MEKKCGLALYRDKRLQEKKWLLYFPYFWEYERNLKVFLRKWWFFKVCWKNNVIKVI